MSALGEVASADFAERDAEDGFLVTPLAGCVLRTFHVVIAKANYLEVRE